MGILFSVYSQFAYKEYIFPGFYNTEEKLFLKKALFGLTEDVTINLEAVNGKWHVMGEWISITMNGIPYSGQEIKDQDSITILTANGERLYVIVQVKDTFFESYDKYSLSGKELIIVGSESDQDISYSFVHNGKSYISKKHVILRRDGKKWSVEDKSSNGTFLNNRRIMEGYSLEYGDHINVWGMDIVYLGNVLGISRGTSQENFSVKLDRWKREDGSQEEKASVNFKETKIYHRSPRSIEILETEPVEIEGPPAPKEVNDTPLLMQIGPALTMMFPMILGSGIAVISSNLSGGTSGVFMYTGMVTAGCSGLIGAFWAINNIRYAEKRRKREETRRFDAYSQYLVKRAEKIKQSYEHNRTILLTRYQAAGDRIKNDSFLLEDLWGRNIHHEDFLYHRLGIGDIPFQVPIAVPKERFTLIQDNLNEKPQMLKENYQLLRDVPVGIDLMKHSLIGIAGGENKAGTDVVVYNLAAQIATQNCYTDVKLAFICSGGDWEERWKFALWFPHVWSGNRKVRFVAYEQSEIREVLFHLTEIFRRRYENGNETIGSNRQNSFRPYYILFVEDESLISGELIEKYIFNSEKDLGLTTVFLAERCEDLPNRCECIVQNDERFSGLCHVKMGEAGKLPIQFDPIAREQVDLLSRKLSSLRVTEQEEGGEIPNTVTFFDMYGINRPEELHGEERWRKNRIYESMKALVGVKSGGAPCYLDLHEKYHGPHGLVAGTTGSGKSETLQTYILSLALNFSPDDVGFFIIDYKGGGMGNLFSGLPHILGQISNLSGNQIRRAMISIKSENLRRQRLFNENGVNNINHYTNLYKNGEIKIPIPHLFIIIDEFAELKREEPDFMRELISVAQVGRSLGVHLILATQKPAGTVDDNIWSNAKFHLCLRVQDRQDSMDMLHKPDAAYLTGAGRGYLQVGNDELYELFQSGWSGAEYDEDEYGKQVFARMITSSGKTAVVGNYEKSRKKAQIRTAWLLKLLQQLESLLTEKKITGKWPDVETEGRLLEEWQKTLILSDEEHLDNDHGRRLLKNLLTLYREAQEKGKDISWIVEQAEKRNWKLPESKKKTQLDVMVQYLADLAKSEGYNIQQPLWLPVLPERISLENIWGENQLVFDGTAWPDQPEKISLKVEVGLCDDPVNQLQEPLTLDFLEDGNHGIFGLPMSGKSTMLQTIVYGLLKRYTPYQLNIYILDFGSRMLDPFEKAPQVGGILYENDLDTVGKLFHMLEKILQERKQLFHGGNFIQYTAKYGTHYPAILLVIDNIASFREKTASVYDDRLVKLSRECSANGIYLLISGASYGTTEVPFRMRDNIRKSICLELSDKYQYVDIFNTAQISLLPESGIPGRGLVKTEEGILEFQACLAVEEQDDYSRLEALRAECEGMKNVWKGKKAKPIPCIPQKPMWPDFRRWEEVQLATSDCRKLPIGYEYETADLYNIDLSSIYCYIISGRARTGKTNLLKIMMRAAALKQMKIAVIEFGSSELQAEATELGAEYAGDLNGYCELMLRILPEFQERNKLKKALRLKAAEDEEIFEAMSQKTPYFVFIWDLVEFSKAMHGKEGEERGFKDFTASILEKGDRLNIYFAACLNQEKQGEVQIQQVYKSFTEYRTGIHLGGCEDAQRLLKFSGLSIRQMGMAEPAGHGYTSETDIHGTAKVIVPLAKG